MNCNSGIIAWLGKYRGQKKQTDKTCVIHETGIVRNWRRNVYFGRVGMQNTIDNILLNEAIKVLPLPT